jgi:hypothetical protein
MMNPGPNNDIVTSNEKLGIHDVEDLVSFGVNPTGTSDGTSSISACPYYLSQVLSKDADLIFAPYNYLLDAKIRKAQRIDIDGAIIVCDEAHNIEDTLKLSGSGEFHEMELLDMILLLSRIFNSYSRKINFIDGGDSSLPDNSHSLLVFIEKIILFLLREKNDFMRKPQGMAAAIKKYRELRLPDDHEFEFTQYAPKGGGHEPSGAKSFFSKLFDDGFNFDKIMVELESLEKYTNVDMTEGSFYGTTILDRLVEFVTLICQSAKQAE